MSTFQNGPANLLVTDKKNVSADAAELNVNKLSMNLQLKEQYILGLKVENQLAEIKKLKESFVG